MASDKSVRAKKGRPFLESGRLPLYTMVTCVVLWLVVLLGFRLDPLQTLLVHLGFVSLVTFLVFGLDKIKAKASGRRASEMNLIALGALGGALGGLLAMATFRHKTQRNLFKIGLPVMLFVHGVIVAVVLLR